MLINCVAYEHGSRLRDLAVEEISDFLQRPDTFVWVALCDASPEEMAQMQIEFGLHDLAVEDARNGNQRPKLEEYDDALFAVLHLIEPDGDGFAVGDLNVFVGSNYILSVRNRSQQGFLGVRARCEREPHLLQQGARFVLYALMDAVVDRYFPIVDRLESELEGIEANIFTEGAARSNIERLYDLKYKVMCVRHAVVPLLEVAAKLSSGRGPVCCAASREYFRDVYDHLLRINASIDSIRETIGTAIQVNLSMVAIGDSEVSKRLAAWAGIFAVATAFAGVWGMNFEVMPELHWKDGYPVALVAIGVTCFLLYRRFRRAGWL